MAGTSASGVRRGGDSYQDLIVCGAALELLRPGSTYTQVEVEVTGAGKVDDVILRSSVGTNLYGQVKWATNPADPLDEEYLFAVKGRGRSILQKLFASYRALSSGGRTPTLRVVTNRTLERSDPLLGHVDGRTELLVPFARDAPPRSDAGKAVTRWAEHVGAAREELLDMLAHLHLRTGRAVNTERLYVRALMVAAGLRDDDEAIDRALATIASWVIGGRRVITPALIAEIVEDLALRRSSPSAILSVQAIDQDPHADDATYVLDWVDLFDGNIPEERVAPHDPSGWQTIDDQIQTAAAALENDGWTSTLVRGAMRQATFFRIGAALPRTRQHTLRYVQGDQTWSTDAAKAHTDPPVVMSHDIAAGPDLAIAVGVSLDPTAEVLTYLRGAGLPVRRLDTITPANGADDQAVASAGHAVVYAEQIRNLVRASVAGAGDCERVHLFLAGPGGLALLLGHRRNRVASTHVYEHLGVGRGYTHAFTVGA